MEGVGKSFQFQAYTKPTNCMHIKPCYFSVYVIIFHKNGRKRENTPNERQRSINTPVSMQLFISCYRSVSCSDFTMFVSLHSTSFNESCKLIAIAFESDSFFLFTNFVHLNTICLVILPGMNIYLRYEKVLIRFASFRMSFLMRIGQPAS